MYGLWVLGGVFAYAAAFVLQCRKRKEWLFSVLTTTILSVLAGFVAAKAGYVFLQLEDTLLYDGAAAFWDFRPDGFSFFCGVAGATGGVCLGAFLFHRPLQEQLRLAAPGLAFLTAFLRAGESELGTVGVGRYVQAQSPFARFPFAVVNSYGEYLYAVFYLEALFALLLALFLLSRRKGLFYELRGEFFLFFLALSQILCESLRARCMRWGFVRVEQLLCGLWTIAGLFFVCARRKDVLSVPRRFWPVAAGLLPLGAIGYLEYALDKTGVPVWSCYALMICALCATGFLWLYVARKLKPEGQK